MPLKRPRLTIGKVFTRIDRYISQLFWTFFLSGLVVFITLYVAVDAMSMSVRFKPPAAVLASFYLYSIPSVLVQMLPIACLLATVFTLAGMSRNNETTALFTMGMSLARISTPILTWVAVISVLGFWISDRVIPSFSKQKNYIYYVEIEKRPSLFSTVKTDKIWYRSGNTLFNLGVLNAEARRAENVMFYYFDNAWNLVQLISAKSMQQRQEGKQWELQNGTVTLFSEDSSFPLTQTFEAKTIYLQEEIGDLQTMGKSSESLSAAALWRYIRKNKEAGLQTLSYEVDYHAKFSFAFAAFVMSFIGIPFSIGKTRAAGWAKNVGICLFLSFAYWAFFSSGLTLGRHGFIPPVLAAWAPNIIALAANLILLFRLRR